MVSQRLIATVNILNGVAVQSINFKNYLPIGDPEIAISFLNDWGIDEIIILDIKATLNQDCTLFKYLPQYVSNCQSPITAGGGVRNLQDIENLIRNGADKVVINSSFFNDSNLLQEGIKEFGSQAFVISIDVKKVNNEYIIFTESFSKRVNLPINKAMEAINDSGAGEVIVNSIDNDGSKTGFDISLLKYVKSKLNIPVIGCGGAGRPSHFIKASQIGLSGLAAGNFFHFNEHSVMVLKGFLNTNGQDVRIDSDSNYLKHNFCSQGRLSIKSEKSLESLKYHYIPPEEI